MNGPHTAEGWVLKLGRERPDLSPSEMHVLSVLSMRHNRDYGAAHPKINLLHRETHISVRQIQRILNALADHDRPGGPVLHISFGPLPMENKAGNPVYGNVYRFIDFDPIPETARPRRRDVVDTRPHPSDTMSHTPSDAVSVGRSDTGDTDHVTSGATPSDTGDTDHVTSVRLPLYPVNNPASKRSEEHLEGRNPVVNPRAHAREPRPVDDAFLESLETEFAPAFGSREAVKDKIAAALSHKARRKYTDQRAYLRNWLRGDVERMPVRRNGHDPPSTEHQRAREEMERKFGYLRGTA